MKYYEGQKFLLDCYSFGSENSPTKERNLYLINTSEFPINMDGAGQHTFFIKKMARGFIKFGFNVSVVEDLNSIEDSENNIILLCQPNHGIFGSRPSRIDPNLMLQVALKFKKSCFLLYAFNNEDFENLPFERYILTDNAYENFIGINPIVETYQNSNKFAPIKLGTLLFPEEIELVQNNRKTYERQYDCLYIGSPYNYDWTLEITKNFNSFVHTAFGWDAVFLLGPDRIEKYLESNFSLCFQCKTGGVGYGYIRNGVITERIWESLSLGLACVTEFKEIEEYTNGIVKYISSPDEGIKYINYLKENKDAFYSIIDAGFEYTKKNRNYVQTAQQIVLKAEFMGMPAQ